MGHRRPSGHLPNPAGAALPGHPAVILAVLLVLPAGAAWAQAPDAPVLLYLNFATGAESLTVAGTDDAVANQSALGGAAPYPAFAWPGLIDGSLTRRELVRTIARQVDEAFTPYNVLITTHRPASGPYTMVLIGGSPTLFGYDARIGGVAIMDCGNQQPSNIVFAFPTALRGSLHGLFATVAQEAAHAFGLEHTTDPNDIMFPRVDPAQHLFVDRETPIDGQRLCGRQTQNSHLRLLSILGPWTGGPKPLDDGAAPDLTPPVLAVAEPGPGTPLVVQPFAVRAAVSDESEVAEVTLEAGGEVIRSARAPYEWSLDGFEPGPLELTLTAVDGSGNRASTSLRVMVAGASGGCALAGAPRHGPGRPGTLAVLLLGLILARRTCRGGSRGL